MTLLSNKQPQKRLEPSGSDLYRRYLNSPGNQRTGELYRKMSSSRSQVLSKQSGPGKSPSRLTDKTK